MVSPTVSSTFVFADIAGFTALTEAHGDEDAAALVAEFCATVGEELPASGGSQVKAIGDAVMLSIPDPGDAVLLGLRRSARLRAGPCRRRRRATPSVAWPSIRSVPAGRLVYRNTTYFFCSLACAGQFASDPERFAA